MTKTYTLSEISQVVDIAATLPDSWFRGHSKVFDELTPGIFREKYQEKTQIDTQNKIQIEYKMIESFKRGAPALSDKAPGPEDYISWLFLMQHHRTPTRLLDWSESALIALYFVVSDKDATKTDGELWAMSPNELNGKSLKAAGFPTLNHPKLRFLSIEPFQAELKELSSSLTLESMLTEKTNKPLAILPPMNFSRMVAQMSVFTIHPRPSPGNTIPELLKDKRHLVRYIIPAGEKKNQLQKDLKSLGINHHTLFPDLDSLSKSIVEKHLSNDYSTHEPPECGGEYEIQK